MHWHYNDVEGMLADITGWIREDFGSGWLVEYQAAQLTEPPPDASGRDGMIRHMFLHNHQFHEVCCVLEGRIMLQINDRIVQVREREMCIIRPGHFHNELAIRGEKGLFLWLGFTPSGAAINVSGTNKDGEFVQTSGRSVKLEPLYFNLILSDIAREMNTDEPSRTDMVKTYVLQLLILTLRLLRSAEKPHTPEEWRESVVRDVLQYITEHGGRGIEMGELMTRTSISINHLNNIFKSVTGKTIMSYCGESRIRQAKEMLRGSSVKVKDLAESLGYYDQYHFCKAFKKATGMSPTQYRAAGIE